MNEQFKILTWMYENRGVFPLSSGKVYEAYQETEDYQSGQNAFSALLSKLHGKELVEKPEYGVYSISEKGVRVSKKLLDEDIDSFERPDGYAEVVKILDYFMMENKLEDIQKSILDGENVRFSLLRLEKYNYEIIDFFKENPESFQAALEEALGMNVEGSVTPNYQLVPDVDWLETTLGQARNSSELGKPVVVEGIVKKAEQVCPMIVSAVFECSQCGDLQEKEQDSAQLKSPYKCDSCGSRKFDIHEKTCNDVIDFELSHRDQKETTIKARLTGSPDLGLNVQHDLMTGSNLKLIGVIQEVGPQKKDSSKMDTYIDVIDYSRADKKKDISEISDDKKKRVREKIEESEDPYNDFALSLAPGLGNLELPKKCVTASLIGSTPIDDEGVGSKDFGRIHTGIIANPGLGKSGLQNWVKNNFEKTYQAQGKSGTGTGLTATAEQSKGGEWRLVAGKLVFADQGILQIDEFDKFQKGELASLNTAMETGFFEVDKASVSAELPGRATVIATGNFEGKLDQYSKPYEKLPEKGEGLYDRFALMCAITESGSEAHSSISGRFMEESSDSEEVLFDVEELRVFRHLAQSCEPHLDEESYKPLKQFIDEASEASNGSLRGESNRFLVQLIKLTLAVARANLRTDTAEPEDAEKAISLMRQSRESLGLDVGDRGASTELKEHRQLEKVKECYRELVDPTSGDKQVDLTTLEEKVVEETNLSSTVFEDVIQKLKREGEMFEPEQGRVAKV